MLTAILLASQPLWLAVQAEDYDLGSQAKTMAAPVDAYIRMGATGRSVQTGELLTAGEMAAVNQITTSGRQTIDLNALGLATSGRVNLVSDLGQNLTSLVIPKGVTALGDFSKINGLNLAGNLVNSGNLYAFSTSTATSLAQIAAANILNNQGALLSTVLPADSLGVPNAISGMGLSLEAINDIVNAGVISSSAALTLSTGGRLDNSGGAVQAQEALNIVTNSISNAGGVFSSAAGAINITALDKNIAITGGDWYANVMNVAAINGKVNMNINDITAVLNITGCEAHVIANTDNFKLGRLDLNGDPVFANFAGDYEITSNITTNGGPLAILATGNIFVNGATMISTDNLTGDAGDIIMVAGATLNQPVDDIIVSAGSGGSIDLSGAVLSSWGGNLSNDANGGDIQLIAFGGAGSVGSVIASSTYAGGSGTGINGDVTVIAGAPGAGNSVQIGIVESWGGTGPANVEIYTATPTGSVTIDDVTGAVVSGSFGVGATQAAGANYDFMIVEGGNVAIEAGTTVSGNNIDVGDFVKPNMSGGSINLQGNAVSIAPGSLLRASGDGSGSGGTITITAQTGLLSVANIEANGGSTGNGGTVNISANNASAANVGDISALAGGTAGDGGTVTVTNSGTGAANVGDITTAAPAGSAGDVTVTGDAVTVDSAATTGRDAGGDVSLTATGAFTQAVVLGAINTSSTQGDGGNFSISANDSVNLFGSVQTTGSGVGNTDGDVTVSGSIIAAPNGLTILASNADSGDVLLQPSSGSVASAGPINIQASGDVSLVSAAGAKSLSSGGSPISITADGNLQASDFTIRSWNGGGGNGGNISLIAQSVDVGNVQSTGLGATGSAGDVVIFTFATMTVNGTIDASAIGVGDGGDVYLQVNSAAAFVAPKVTAAGGGTSGDGGSVTYSNIDTGGVTISFANRPEVPVTLGSGGNITVDSILGPINFQNGMTLNTSGVGNPDGVIYIEGSELVSTAGNVQLFSNGGGSNGRVFVFTHVGDVVTNGFDLTITASDSVDLGLNSTTILTGGIASGGDVTVNAGGTIDATEVRFDTTAGALFNPSGDVTLNAGPAAALILDGPITTSSGSSIAGNVTLTAGTGGLTFGGPITATALLAGGTGGNIIINSDQTSLMSLPALNADGANTDGGVTVSTDGALTATGLVRGAAVSLTAGGGDLTINDEVTASGTVNLSAGGTIVQNSILPISGTALSIIFGTGSVTISTDVTSVGVLAPAQTITVNELNDISITAGASTDISNLTINALTGDITNSGIVAINNNLILNADSISLTQDVTAGGDVTLNATSSISQNAGTTITADDLSVSCTNSSVSLTTNVNALQSTLPGFTLTISESDGIILNAPQNVSSLSVTAGVAGAGSLVTNPSIALAGALTLNSNNGDVVLNNSISATNVVLQASGNINQNAGLISGTNLTVSVGAPSTTLATSTNSLLVTGGGTVTVNEADGVAVSTAGPVQDLFINAGQSGAGDLDAQSITASGDVSLINANGNILLSNNVQAGDDLSLNASGFVFQSAGKLTAQDLSVVSGSSSLITLTTDVGTIGISTFGDITVNEDSGISVLSYFGAAFNLTAANVSAGDVNFPVPLTFGNATVQTVSAGSNILFNSNLNANDLSLTVGATGGGIQQNAGVITSSTFNATAQDGDIEGAFNSALQLAGTSSMTVQLNTSGDVNVRTNGNGGIGLVGSTGDDFVFSSGGLLVTSTTVNANSITLTTNSLTNNASITAVNYVTIQSHPAASLSINGTGSISGGPFGPPGTPVDPPAVLISASEGSISLSGTQSFNGDVELDSPLGQVLVNAGATYTGAHNVVVHAPTLTLNGTLTGNNLIFSAANEGTIINTVGDINLPVNLTLNGSNLAIIAAGNINSTGLTSINLSNAGGAAGSLLLIAGYTANPATTGTVRTAAPYTLSTPSAGGSINLSGVLIDLSSSAGNGGDLTAVANGGSVTLGTVITQSTVAVSGDILIVGETGVLTNTLLAQGSTNGNVEVSVSEAVVTGPFVVTNGTITSGSIAADSVITNGNVTLGGVAGDTVTLRGALTGANNFDLGSLTANTVNILAGAGSVSSIFGDLNQINSNALGTVTLADTASGATLNNIVGASQQFQLTSTGAISTTQNISIQSISLTSSTVSNILLNNNVTASTTVSLTTEGGIVQLGGTKVSGGSLVVDFGTANTVTLATNVTSIQSLDGGTLILNEDSGVTVLSQNVTNLTVNVSGAGTITTGANLVITGDLIFDNNSGGVAINHNITADDITIDVSGNITRLAPALISGNSLSIQAPTSNDFSLSTALNSFAMNAPDAVVSLGQTGSITFGTIVAEGLTMGFATPLNITINGNITIVGVNDYLGITSQPGGNPNNPGAIISGPGLITSPDVLIQNGVGSVTINTNAHLFALVNSPNSDLVVNEVNDIVVTGSLGKNVTINAVNRIYSQGGTLTAAENLLLNTPSLVLNTGALAGDSVVVTSPSNLLVTGVGTVTSSTVTNFEVTQPGASLTFGPASGLPIGLNAFEGSSQITFNGPTNLNAVGPGQSVVLAGGSTTSVNGNDALTVTTSTFNQASNTTITGNPLRFVAPGGQGTIANPSGDLVLPMSFTFVGESLAILASGNVIASTAATAIKLSNANGNAGDLTIIAGYNFTQNSGAVPDPTFKVPGLGSFTLGAPTAEGGSILMPKTAITTTATYTGTNATVGTTGGNVVMIANGGTDNSGMIAVGAIDTSSKKGVAGSVTLIGEGGVQALGITTKGVTGGDVTVAGATPVIVGGGINVIDGVLSGPGLFTVGASSFLDAGAVLVNGKINTSGTGFRGGDVQLVGYGAVEVPGGIVTNGLTVPNALVPRAGGDVSISSLVKVAIGTSGINTSALATKTLPVAGAAGNITVTANDLINTGRLVAKGGANTGSGDGGAGGAIIVASIYSVTNSSVLYYPGAIKVTGFVDSRGGAAAATGSGDGGAGGTVTLQAGTVAVTGSTSGASIIASGGLGGATGNQGAGAIVLLNTFSIQQLPTNLDLTSTTKNQVLLPGGLFTVGVANPVNGVASTIVSNANKFDKTTGGNGQIQTPGISVGLIVLDVEGAAQLDPNGKRLLVTPATALRQFTADRNNGVPTLTVDPVGKANGGFATLQEQELSSKVFTAFKLPAGVGLTVQGQRPLLNLPSTTLVSGTIDFPTLNATNYMNLGSGMLTVNVGAQITADLSSTLILSGTGGTYTNKGTIDVGTLLLARPGTTALNFVGEAGSTTIANQILLARSFDVGMAVKFTAKGATLYSAPVLLFDIPVGAHYRANATAYAANATKPRTLALNFTLREGSATAVAGVVNGTFSGTAVTIKGLDSKITGSPVVSTAISIGDNTVLTTTKSILINSTDLVAIGNDVTLSAGVLKANAPTFADPALLTAANIQSAGAITLTGPNVTMGGGNQFFSNGGKTLLTSTVGHIVMIGDGNTIQVMGGDAVMLAKGSVIGGTNTTINAKGFAGASNGGIEIGSGLTTGKLSSAFAASAAGQRAGNIGTININGTPGTGAVLSNITGSGTVNLNNAILNLGSGSPAGAMMFDSVNGSVSIGGTFTSKSAKPIAFTSTVSPRSIITFTDDETRSTEYGAKVTGISGAKMTVDGDGIKLIDGEILVEATEPTAIETIHGLVQLKKGAIAHIDSRNSNSHVKACSGDVLLYGFDHKFVVAPGQEVILSAHAPQPGDMRPADGVGRRNQEVKKLTGGHAILSDFSLLTVVSHQPALKNNKSLLNRMLKFAAAIDMVTKVRGAYIATPREPRGNVEAPGYAASGNHLSPVSYSPSISPVDR